MRVIILRGLPGSLKSTWAAQQENSIVLSTDDYFMVDGEYKFDPTKLSEAHLWNMKEYYREIHKPRPLSLKKETTICVANTSTQLWEMSYYVSLARVLCLLPEIIWFKCSVETSKARNSHGVPDKVIESMNERFQNKGKDVLGCPQKIIETDSISMDET